MNRGEFTHGGGLLFRLEPMLKTLNPKINDSTAKMMRSLERAKSWVSPRNWAKPLVNRGRVLRAAL